MKWWAWILLVPAAFFTAFVLNVWTSPPLTYSDLAADLTAACVRNKGDGGWRASSGITLQTYCSSRATIETMDKLCRAHPEKC